MFYDRQRGMSAIEVEACNGQVCVRSRATGRDARVISRAVSKVLPWAALVGLLIYANSRSK